MALLTCIRSCRPGSWMLGYLLSRVALQAQTPLGALIAEQSRTQFSIGGAGARAMGQGGAFTAVADDATAVSFNPAGLAQLLRPEMAFSLEANRKTFAFEGFNTSLGARQLEVTDSSVTHTSVVPRFIAATIPLDWAGRNLVIQASIQRQLSFAESGTRRMTEFPATPDPSFPILRRDVSLTLDQRGQIDLYGLAMAYEFNQRWLGGIAYNRWRGVWDIESHNTTAEVVLDGGNPVEVAPYFIHYAQQSRISGANWTCGLLGRWPGFRIGFNWRTPFLASYQFASQVTQNLFPDSADFNIPAREARLRWPQTISAGIAWKPRPQWQFALDWSQTPWSRLRIQGGGEDVDGVNFLDLRKDTRIPDVTEVRAGFEYLWFLGRRGILPLRAGLFWEPQPVVDGLTGRQRILKGMTLGTGFRDRHMGVDLAYRYSQSHRLASRFLEVDDLLIGNAPTSKGEERLEIHRVEISVLVVLGERLEAGRMGEKVSAFFHWLLRGN